MHMLMTAATWPFRSAYRGLSRVANSSIALISSYFVLLVTAGGLFMYFEDRKGLGEAMWWAVVTASTVGYGDMYPETAGGRIVAAILISVMVLLVIPLITAHFASKLIVDHDAFRHDEQEEIKENLRRVRALTELLTQALVDARATTHPLEGGPTGDPGTGARPPTGGGHPA